MLRLAVVVALALSSVFASLSFDVNKSYRYEHTLQLDTAPPNGNADVYIPSTVGAGTLKPQHAATSIVLALHVLNETCTVQYGCQYVAEVSVESVRQVHVHGESHLSRLAHASAFPPVMVVAINDTGRFDHFLWLDEAQLLDDGTVHEDGRSDAGRIALRLLGHMEFTSPHQLGKTHTNPGRLYEEWDVNGVHQAQYAAVDEQDDAYVLRRSRSLKDHPHLQNAFRVDAETHVLYGPYAYAHHAEEHLKHHRFSHESVLRIDRDTGILQHATGVEFLAIPHPGLHSAGFRPRNGDQEAHLHQATSTWSVKLLDVKTTAEHQWGGRNTRGIHERAHALSLEASVHTRNGRSTDSDIARFSFTGPAHDNVDNENKRNNANTLPCTTVSAVKLLGNLTRIATDATFAHSIALFFEHCPDIALEIAHDYVLEPGIPDPAGGACPDDLPTDKMSNVHRRQMAVVMTFGLASARCPACANAILSCLQGDCGGPLSARWRIFTLHALLVSSHIPDSVYTALRDLHNADPSDTPLLLTLGTIAHKLSNDSRGTSLRRHLISLLLNAPLSRTDAHQNALLTSLANTHHLEALPHVLEHARSHYSNKVRTNALWCLHAFDDPRAELYTLDIAMNRTLSPDDRRSAFASFTSRHTLSESTLSAMRSLEQIHLHEEVIDHPHQDPAILVRLTRHLLDRHDLNSHRPNRIESERAHLNGHDQQEIDDRRERDRRRRRQSLSDVVVQVTDHLSSSVDTVNELYRQRRVTDEEAANLLNKLLDNTPWGDIDFEGGFSFLNGENWGVADFNTGYRLEFDNSIHFRMRGLREIFLSLRIFDEILVYFSLYGLEGIIRQKLIDMQIDLGYMIETVNANPPSTRTCASWIGEQSASTAWTDDNEFECPCSVPLSAMFSIKAGGLKKIGMPPSELFWRSTLGPTSTAMFPEADYCMQSVRRSLGGDRPGRFCCYKWYDSGNPDTVFTQSAQQYSSSFTVNGLPRRDVYQGGAYLLITDGKSAGFDVRHTPVTLDRQGSYHFKTEEVDPHLACRAAGRLDDFYRYRPRNNGASCPRLSVDTPDASFVTQPTYEKRSVTEASFYFVASQQGKLLFKRTPKFGTVELGFGHIVKENHAGIDQYPQDTIERFDAWELLALDLVSAEMCVHEDLVAHNINLNDNQFAALCSYVMTVSCDELRDHKDYKALLSSDDKDGIRNMLMEKPAVRNLGRDRARMVAEVNLWEAFATMSWVADAPRDLYKEVEYFQVQIELAPMATVIDAIKEYMDRKKKGKSKKDDEEEIDPEFPNDDPPQPNQGTVTVGLRMTIFIPLPEVLIYGFPEKGGEFYVGPFQIYVEGSAGIYAGVDILFTIDIRKWALELNSEPFIYVGADVKIAIGIFIVRAGVHLNVELARVTLLPEVTYNVGSWPIGVCYKYSIRLDPAFVILSAFVQWRDSLECYVFGCKLTWGSMDSWLIWRYDLGGLIIPLIPKFCLQISDSFEPSVTVESYDDVDLGNVGSGGEMSTDLRRRRSIPDSSFVYSVWDGTVTADVDYWSRKDEAVCAWRDFSSANSRVFKYKVGLGTTTLDADVASMVDVRSATSHTFRQLNLETRTRYFCLLEVWAASGQRTKRFFSNGFLVDSTSVSENCQLDPSLGCEVKDGLWPPEDADWQWSTEILFAQWNTLLDPDSPTFYTIFAQTLSGNDLVKESEYVGFQLSSTLRAPLRHNETYFYGVRVVNAAGLSSSFRSDGIRIDETPPPPALVHIPTAFPDTRPAFALSDLNTTAVSQLWTSDVESLSVSFEDYDDPESGAYSWKLTCGPNPVASSPLEPAEDPPFIVGSVFQKPVTPRDNTDTHSFTELDLAHRVTMFCWLEVRNGARLYTTSLSRPFTVDALTPVVLRVDDGLPGEPEWQYRANGSLVCARWQLEALSGARQVQLSVVARKRVPTGSTTVVEENVICEQSSVVRSEDLSSEVYTLCALGADGDERSCTCNRTTVSLRVDTHDVLSWTNLGGPARSSCLTTITPLPILSQIVSIVRFQNGAGVWSSMTESDGFMIDTTPPVAGVVTDGCRSRMDTDVWSNANVICVHVRGWFDRESAIAGFYAFWGSTPGASDIADPAWFPAGSPGVAVDLSLATNSTVYATVEVHNGAGLTTTLSSNGVLIDPLAPVAGDFVAFDSDQVNATAVLAEPDTWLRLLNPEFELSLNNHTVCAVWTAFEQTVSGMSHYQVGLGQSTLIADIVPMRTHSASTNGVCFRNLELDDGLTPVVHLHGFSRAGLKTVVFTKSYIVDTSAPRAGIILDGDGYDRDVVVNNTAVRCSWTPMVSRQALSSVRSASSSLDDFVGRAFLLHRSDGPLAFVPGDLVRPLTDGTSCEDVRDNLGESTPSGEYTLVDATLSSKSNQRRTAYCDMTTAKGGWELLGRFSNRDLEARWADAHAWMPGAAFGSAADASRADYRSSTWDSAHVSDLLLADPDASASDYVATIQNCAENQTLSTLFANVFAATTVCPASGSCVPPTVTRTLGNGQYGCAYAGFTCASSSYTCLQNRCMESCVHNTDPRTNGHECLWRGHSQPYGSPCFSMAQCRRGLTCTSSTCSTPSFNMDTNVAYERAVGSSTKATTVSGNECTFPFLRSYEQLANTVQLSHCTLVDDIDARRGAFTYLGSASCTIGGVDEACVAMEYTWGSDGNTGTTLKTRAISSQWIEVDLEDEYIVDLVRVWNSLGANGPSAFYIELLNAQHSVVTQSATFSSTSATQFEWNLESVTVQPNIRFVRFRASSKMTMSDVQVFARGSTLPNIATELFKTVTQSGSSTATASVAIDGSRDTYTTTSNSDGAWWQGDFEQLILVSHVRVWNRADSHAARMTGMQVVLYDESGSEIVRSVAFNGVQRHYDYNPIEAGVSEEDRRRVRFIRVQLPTGNTLSVAEIEVHGTRSRTTLCPSEDDPYYPNSLTCLWTEANIPVAKRCRVHEECLTQFCNPTTGKCDYFPSALLPQRTCSKIASHSEPDYTLTGCYSDQHDAHTRLGLLPYDDDTIVSLPRYVYNAIHTLNGSLAQSLTEHDPLLPLSVTAEDMTIYTCRHLCVWHGYEYNGLKKDSGCWCRTVERNETLYVAFPTSPYTAQECFLHCSRAGYSVAGLRPGGACGCAQSLASLATVSSGECSAVCTSGDACGGPNGRVSVYSRAHYGYVGCYADNVNTGAVALVALQTPSLAGGVTPQKCFEACTASYSYFGLRDGTTCVCGNSLGVTSRSLDIHCNLPCVGNSSVACGGALVTSLYRTGDSWSAVNATSRTVNSLSTSECVSKAQLDAWDNGTTVTQATLADCRDFCAESSVYAAWAHTSFKCLCLDDASTYLRDGTVSCSKPFAVYLSEASSAAAQSTYAVCDALLPIGDEGARDRDNTTLFRRLHSSGPCRLSGNAPLVAACSRVAACADATQGQECAALASNAAARLRGYVKECRVASAGAPAWMKNRFDESLVSNGTLHLGGMSQDGTIVTPLSVTWDRSEPTGAGHVEVDEAQNSVLLARMLRTMGDAYAEEHANEALPYAADIGNTEHCHGDPTECAALFPAIVQLYGRSTSLELVSGRRLRFLALASINRNLVGFLEPESFDLTFTACLGTAPLVCDVVSERSTDAVSEILFDNLALAEGVRYYATVNATNRLGLTSTSFSDGFYFDPTVPEGGAVRDIAHMPEGSVDGASPVDVDAVVGATNVSVCFEVFQTSVTSPMELYEVGVGLFPGKDDVLNFTTVSETPERDYVDGNGTRWLCVAQDLSESGLLKQGVHYFVTVRGRNAGKLWAQALSDGFVVDGTAPVAATDALRVDDFHVTLGYLNQAVLQLSLSWSAFEEDTDTEMTLHVSLVDETVAPPLPIEWLLLGGVERAMGRHTFFNVSLIVGHAYRLRVRATNLASLSTVRATSALVYDPTAPAAGIVRISAAVPVALTPVNASDDYVISGETLCVVFGNFSDPDGTPMLSYTASVSNDSLSEHILFTSAPIESTGAPFYHVCLALALTDRSDYYVRVEGTSAAALTSTAVAPSVRAVLTGPEGGVVSDGPEAPYVDEDYISCMVQDRVYESHWHQFHSESAGGIDGYLVSLFIDGDTTSVPLVEAQVGASVSNFTFVLPADVQNVAVHTRVRAYNRARVYSDLMSDGLLCDTTVVDTSAMTVLPLCEASRVRLTGFVVVRTLFTSPAQVYFISNIGDMCVSWSGAEDLQSGVASYEVALSAQEDEDDAEVFRFAGDATVTRFGGFGGVANLTERHGLDLLVHYVVVRATNGANMTTEHSSGAFVVDKTSAVMGSLSISSLVHVVPGIGDVAPRAFLPSTDELCASYMDVADPESGVYTLEYGVVDVLNGSLVQEYTSLTSGASGTVCVSSLGLVQGQAVAMQMRATNGAGLVSLFRSDSVVVDTVAPTEGTLAVRDLSPAGYFVDTRDVVCAVWDNFDDAVSGLQKMEVSLTDVGTSTLLESTVGYNNATAATAGAGLALGSSDGVCFNQSVLVQGRSYRVTLVLTDFVGLTASATREFLVERTAPVMTTNFTVPSGIVTGTVQATWAVADPETGIATCEWGFGTRPNIIDLTAPALLDGAACHTGDLDTSVIATGMSAYVTVHVTNGAGFRSTFSSADYRMNAAVVRRRRETTSDSSGGTDTMRVINTPPVAGDVYDGGSLSERRFDYSSDATQLRVSWERFFDRNVAFDIDVAIVQKGTLEDPRQYDFNTELAEGAALSSFGTVLIDYVAVNSSLHNTSLSAALLSGSPSSFPEGVRLSACVRARNIANLVSRTVCTNGVLLDTSVPTAGTVLDGMFGVDQRIQGSSNGLAVTFHGFYDAQSAPLTGTAAPASGTLPVPGTDLSSWDGSYVAPVFRHGQPMTYAVAFSEMSGVDVDTLEWTSAGTQTVFMLTGLTLEHEHLYYVYVCAFNPMLLRVCAQSDGITVLTNTTDLALFDTTPPRAFTVVREPTAAVTANATFLAVHWPVCVDDTSVCSHCLVYHFDNTTDAVVSVDRVVYPGVDFATNALAMESGHAYSAIVSCCNQADTCRNVSTARFTVDLTPPLLEVGPLGTDVALSTNASEVFVQRLEGVSQGISVFVRTRDVESTAATASYRVWVNGSLSSTAWTRFAVEKSVQIQIVSATDADTIAIELTSTNSVGLVRTRTVSLSMELATSRPTLSLVYLGAMAQTEATLVYTQASSESLQLRGALEPSSVSSPVNILYRVHTFEFAALTASVDGNVTIAALDAARSMAAADTTTSWMRLVNRNAADVVLNMTAVADGRLVYAEAVAENLAGARSDVSDSLALLVVDHSAPEVRVWDGRVSGDVSAFVEATPACSWFVTEPHVALAQVRVCIRNNVTHEVACATLDSTTHTQIELRDGMHAFAVSDANFVNGTRYYCAVTVTSEAQWVSETDVSDGQVKFNAGAIGVYVDRALPQLFTIAIPSESRESTSPWDRVQVLVPPADFIGDNTNAVWIVFSSVAAGMRVSLDVVVERRKTTLSTHTPVVLTFLPVENGATGTSEMAGSLAGSVEPSSAVTSASSGCGGTPTYGTDGSVSVEVCTSAQVGFQEAAGGSNLFAIVFGTVWTLAALVACVMLGRLWWMRRQLEQADPATGKSFGELRSELQQMSTMQMIENEWHASPTAVRDASFIEDVPESLGLPPRWRGKVVKPIADLINQGVKETGQRAPLIDVDQITDSSSVDVLLE